MLKIDGDIIQANHPYSLNANRWPARTRAFLSSALHRQAAATMVARALGIDSAGAGAPHGVAPAAPSFRATAEQIVALIARDLTITHCEAGKGLRRRSAPCAPVCRQCAAQGCPASQDRPTIDPQASRMEARNG